MIAPHALDSIRGGDRRALAKALTEIESGSGHSALTRNPAVPVIGITGPPGVGKSTLVNALISSIRGTGDQVAVVAVDPSSPITGGALLGDRIRMQGHAGDDGVFVRSMASRGHLGGLSSATGQAVELLTTAGFDLVLVETVGVGQSEVEIMDLADLVVLVVAPGFGDQIQADKAGIVEIADAFVINKADREGVDVVRRALLDVATTGGRTRPVLQTVATSGAGTDDLLEAIRALL